MAEFCYATRNESQGKMKVKSKLSHSRLRARISYVRLSSDHKNGQIAMEKACGLQGRTEEGGRWWRCRELLQSQELRPTPISTFPISTWLWTTKGEGRIGIIFFVVSKKSCFPNFKQLVCLKKKKNNRFISKTVSVTVKKKISWGAGYLFSDKRFRDTSPVQKAQKS